MCPTSTITPGSAGSLLGVDGKSQGLLWGGAPQLPLTCVGSGQSLHLSWPKGVGQLGSDPLTGRVHSGDVKSSHADVKITNQVAKGSSSFADSRKQLQTYLHSPQEPPPTLTALELLTKWPACPWGPRKQSAHRALRPTASRAPPLRSELLDPRQPDCPGLMCIRWFDCFGPGNSWSRGLGLG